MKTTPSYDIRTKHSDTYYLRVIQGMLSGLRAGLGDKDIASHLNKLGVFSATGAPWTVTAGVQALHKLRSSSNYGSHLHTAILRLCFDGVLTKAQVLPLIEPRKTPRARM